MTPSQGHALATTTTTSTRSLAAVILAAGKGKRLKSARPKVLHAVCGKPALWHVMQTALAAHPDRIVIVVAQDADDVRAAVKSWKITPRPVFVEQAKQLGTGHAVLAAKSPSDASTTSWWRTGTSTRCCRKTSAPSSAASAGRRRRHDRLDGSCAIPGRTSGSSVTAAA